MEKFKNYINVINYLIQIAKKFGSTQEIEFVILGIMLLKKCSFNLKNLLKKLQMNQNICPIYLAVNVDY